jgi:hypothetical protein
MVSRGLVLFPKSHAIPSTLDSDSFAPDCIHQSSSGWSLPILQDASAMSPCVWHRIMQLTADLVGTLVENEHVRIDVLHWSVDAPATAAFIASFDSLANCFCFFRTYG